MVEKYRYWLWIIPNRIPGLWNLCRELNILAAFYPYDEIRESRRLRNFVEIDEGDYVVAYLNNNTIGGIGKVTKLLFDATHQYRWQDKIDANADHLSAISIEWELVDEFGFQYDEGRIFDLIGIARLFVTTVHNMNPRYFKATKNWFKNQLKDIDDSARYSKPLKYDSLIAAQDLWLGETSLRDFIPGRLEDIFGTGWVMFEDNDGNQGVEYRLKSGEADLIFIDPTDSVTIIELKVVQARKQHVEQLARYCSEFEKLFSEKAKGILVAPGITSKAKKLITANKILQYRQFTMYFEFK